MSTMQKLRALALAGYYKIHKNRFKDREVPGKWPVEDHDLEGVRTWSRCSPLWLHQKLLEEVRELALASHDLRAVPFSRDYGAEEARSCLLEAGDVTNMAMMLADRSGVWEVEPLPPKIVCLCGSTKFRKEFEDANFRETMAGNIVLSVGFFAHSDKERHTLTPDEKIRLDQLHKWKIDLADEILVINVGDYIGESTRSEIEHARATGKRVRYWLEATVAPPLLSVISNLPY